MEENISPEQYRAEITALNHEIAQLNRQLAQKELEQSGGKLIDRYGPFENPTEYKGFGGDYSGIQPLIQEVGYELPLEPDYEERINLKKHYSIGGWAVLFQFLLTYGITYLLTVLIVYALTVKNPDVSSDAAFEFMKNSSILASLRLLIYPIFNTALAFVGMKKARIRPVSLIRTKDFGFGTILQYCLGGLLLWVTATYAAMFTTNVFSKYGIDITTVSDYTQTKTGLGMAALILYTVFAAPVTEELFYRGLLLKVFSKASQRFAVIFTAILFGLFQGHIGGFITSMCIGIFLGHITLKHGSVIPAISVRIFLGAVTLLMESMKNTMSEMYLILQITMVAAGVLGAIMLLIFWTGDRLPVNTPNQSTRGFQVASSSLPLDLAIFIGVFFTLYHFTYIS